GRAARRRHPHPLGAATRPRRPPGGPLRRRGPAADDPPRRVLARGVRARGDARARAPGAASSRAHGRPRRAAVIQELGRDEFLALRPEVRALWPEASPQRVDEILPLHAERDGFRAVVEHTEHDGLAGFAYGYRGGAGQWWHDLVAAALGPDGTRRWLPPGHF